jgi:hypothetical protein
VNEKQSFEHCSVESLAEDVRKVGKNAIKVLNCDISLDLAKKTDKQII